MAIFRVSGDALLRLALMAAQPVPGDFDTILAIVRGADLEPPELPDVADGPALGGDPAPGSDDGEADTVLVPAKPAKPE